MCDMFHTIPLIDWKQSSSLLLSISPAATTETAAAEAAVAAAGKMDNVICLHSIRGMASVMLHLILNDGCWLLELGTFELILFLTHEREMETNTDCIETTEIGGWTMSPFRTGRGPCPKAKEVA